MKVEVSKIGRKMYLLVALIMIASFFISCFLNNEVLSRLYLHRMKEKLSYVYGLVEGMTFEELKASAHEIETANGVTIIAVPETGDLDELNSNVRWLLTQNNMPFNKFWITQETIDSVMEGKSVNKLFNQGKTKSSYLTKFFEKEGKLVLIGTTVVHDQDIISIVNEINVYVLFGTIVLGFIMIISFSALIVRPINKLRDSARKMARMNLCRVEVHTGDEIEELADSLNAMCEELKSTHEDMKGRNENLKLLLSNMAHEMKTPLSLLKAYAVGIKDGMDDGSYIDVMLEQIDYAVHKVDDMVYMSKVQRDMLVREDLDIEELVREIVKRHSILAEKSGISVIIDADGLTDTHICADREQLDTAVGNLITNALKYNRGDYVRICLEDAGSNAVHLSMSNRSNEVDRDTLAKLWQPFYVLEESRYKGQSGTGLGLSIVAHIAQAHGFGYGSTYENGEISFLMTLNRSLISLNSCDI